MRRRDDHEKKERWLRRRLQSPMARRMNTRRIATIATLSVVAIVLFAVLVPLATDQGGFLPIVMVLGALAVCAPFIALRRPMLALGAFLVPVLLLPLMTVPTAEIDIPPWPWSVPMMLAFAALVWTVTFEHGWRRGAITAGLIAAVSLLPVVFVPGLAGNATVADLIVTVCVAAATLLLAELVAGRMRVGDELIRERAQTAQEQSRRELVEERARIARELHDVVAHSMSLIQVQASTARYRLPDLPEIAAAEFDDVAATARTSLGEMRRILGVLRTEDQTAELAPQRSIADIPALVETTRRAGAGIAVTGHVDGEADAAVQIALYRITQEALSNAVRHAPGAEITVELSSDAEAVGVRVQNTQTDAPIATPAGGHGLRGMAERAALLGGDVQAGPDSAGGWTVTARLPRHRAAGSQEETE